jgi:ectoine hydroxylase-related dioxygenase (phytanoyl-CoA dioxygenase family)
MIRDLSTEHQPLGALSGNPGSPPLAVLTPSQIESFHREGYVAGIEVLSDAQVDVLTAALADLMRPDHPGRELFHEFHLNESSTPETVLFHALGAWRVSPAFHDLLWVPAIVGAASQLLGGRVRFWHDQLFCKPPRQGGVVAWHQDYSYWTRTQPMAHLTCWIALDDATEDNGCLRYVPRSHRWPLLPITGLAGRMGAIESVLTEEQRQAFVPVPIALPRGSATFHHPLMVHGSSENRSERPRRGAVLNFIRDGVRSASDEPLLQGIPPVPAGEPLAGRFFPLLTPDHAPGRRL